MKKWLIQMLIIVFVMSSLSLTGIAMEDTEAPEVISYTLPNKAFTVGETIEIEAHVVDNVTETPRVNFYLLKPVTKTPLHVSMKAVGNGIYKGSIQVTETMQAGRYRMEDVYGEDEFGNRDSLRYHGEDQWFEVYGTTSDIEPPTLLDYTLGNRAYTVGDVIEVTAHVEDDYTETPHVSFSVKTPITGKRLYIPVKKQEDGLFKGTLEVTDNLESGRYVIDQIYLMDIERNFIHINREEGDDRWFDISGTNPDVEAPKLLSYSLENKKYTIDDIINVTARVEDNVTAKPRVWMTLINPVTGAKINHEMDAQGDGVYNKMIPVKDGIATGRFVLLEVCTKDDQSNFACHKPEEGDDQWIEIQYPETDTIAPVFDHIPTQTIELYEGDVKPFQIVATDDLKLKSATARFVNEKNETVTVTSSNVVAEGFYFDVAHSDFPQQDGEWKLQSLSLYDLNENQSTVTEGLDVVVKTWDKIEPLDAIIVTSNETWERTTINQDVYLMPGVTLKLGEGTVLNGTLHNEGRLRLLGGVSGSGEIRSGGYMIIDSNPGSDSLTTMSGTNSITKKHRFYDHLPFRLSVSPVPGEENLISVSGVFIPLATLYLNGEPLQTKADKTFGLTMPVPEDGLLRFSMTSQFKESYQWTHRVTATDLPVFMDSVPLKISGFTEGRKYYRYITPRFEEGTATLNGQPYTSGTTIKEPGKYTLELDDGFGNKLVKQFTIDRTPPVIDGIKHRQVTNQDVFIHYNEGLATLNGRRIYNNRTVSEAGHYILRVTDQAGNITVREFTIDTVRPDRPTLRTVTDQSTRVTGTAEKGALVYITYNGQTYRTRVSSRTGIYRYYLNTTRVGATVSVKVQDRAGNFSLPRSMRVLKTFRTFTVNPVRSHQSAITGNVRHGAFVRAYVGSKLIGRSGGNSRGMYTMYIRPQKVGTPITIYISKQGYQTIKKTIIVTR
ncbi:Ig-like domain-containing protein [Exiguobacterium algae]|uniref:Ig-like domain-containing protein n=1 Tax=Exiguobacterium algae TaxID=2751250 RepID=UPI001BE9DC5F|nr:Ig-like domain-containing protein [Exiguobacterium algae]